MAALSSFPRPNVAVDVAVLTVIPSRAPRTLPGQLAVVVQRRTSSPEGYALPGRFLREEETVAQCVATALREKVGLSLPVVQPRLLRVFDAPDRDPRGWTISMAHYVVVPYAELADVVSEAAARCELVPVDPAGGASGGLGLLFDHDEIVSSAVATVRERYEVAPDPDGACGGPFTLAELKVVHEGVHGSLLQRDTFRRRMQPQLTPYLVNGAQEMRVDGGRPARMWLPAGSDVTPRVLERLTLPRASSDA